MQYASVPYAQSPDQVKVIRIGGLTVSLAAFVVFVFGVVMALLVAFAAPTVALGSVMALVTLSLFFLQSYSINCLEFGHCHVWAWILTSLLVLTGVVNAVKLASGGK